VPPLSLAVAAELPLLAGCSHGPDHVTPSAEATDVTNIILAATAGASKARLSTCTWTSYQNCQLIERQTRSSILQFLPCEYQATTRQNARTSSICLHL